MDPQRLDLKARRSSVRCAYCHEPADELTQCPACGVLLHEECREARCVTLGCVGGLPALGKGAQGRMRWDLLAVGLMLVAVCVLPCAGIAVAFFLPLILYMLH